MNENEVVQDQTSSSSANNSDDNLSVQLDRICSYFSDSNQIQAEQFSTSNEIEASHFSYYQSQLDDISSSLVELENTLDSMSSSADASVDTPADYYSYMSDVTGQIALYVSLIIGILLCMLMLWRFHK